MKCPNCHQETDSKDRFCSHCGSELTEDARNTSIYEEEIRRFAKEQEDAKKLEKMDDLDLENPIGLLKAQLRLLISIYRRVEKLENKDKPKISVIDFDMPFWSLVNFEFKIFLVGMFFVFVFSCIIFLILSPILKGIISLPFLFSQ